MTDFAGEKYDIVHAAARITSAPGVRPVTTEALTDVDVDHTSVLVYAAGGSVVVAETVMDWDPEIVAWTYEWITTAVVPGTYKAECRVYGLSGAGDVNFEFKRIRLKLRPVGSL